jgi:hypothetical protein
LSSQRERPSWLETEVSSMWRNRNSAANRRPAGQPDGSGNLSATVVVAGLFPAAVAEIER